MHSTVRERPTCSREGTATVSRSPKLINIHLSIVSETSCALAEEFEKADTLSTVIEELASSRECSKARILALDSGVFQIIWNTYVVSRLFPLSCCVVVRQSTKLSLAASAF